MKKDIKNKTTVHSADEILENKEKLAKDFSEGCKELEELLLYCWKNGVLTRGCCAGHKTKRYSLEDERAYGGHGYISFDIDNKRLAKQLSINILRNDFLRSITSKKYEEILVKKSEIAISKWKFKNNGWFGISYYYPSTFSPKISGQVFSELKQCLKTSLSKELRPKNEQEKFFCFMIDNIYQPSHRNCNIYLSLPNMEYDNNNDYVNLLNFYKKQEKKKSANNQLKKEIQEQQTYEL